MAWEEIQAESPGIVAINRYRESPHPRVSFANDFSKRLEPQPGTREELARYIETETEKWGKVVRQANIKPE